MFDELIQLPLHTAPAHNGCIDVHYAAAGSGDLLLLIHGSLCDLRYWRWQLKKLPAHVQVAALSLPDYWPHHASLNPYATNFDFDLHVAAVADVVQTLHLPQQKLYVLGHSRGAQVATHYAWQHTEKVTGLILADAAFNIDEATPALPVLQEAALRLMQGDDEAGLGLFIDAVSGAHTWQKMVGWFKTMVQDNAHTLIAQSQEALPSVSTAQIQQLAQTPTLLINGAHSPERYQRSTQGLLHALPHAQHVVINKAAHGMNLANPKAFDRAILDFINQSCAL